METHIWLSGGIIVALTFVVVVGVSATIVHMLRERALRREREGLQPRSHVPNDKDIEKTEGRASQYAAVRAAPDALGWTSAPSGAKPADVPAVKQAKTILVADDDPVIAMALKKRLQRLGYNVLRSPDSAHALLGAMKTNPDLVILDVNMPGGNGLAVCEMMATDPQNAATPVIVHTTRNDEETKWRTRELGARYVEKSPSSWEEILAIVVELIGAATVESEAPPPAPTDIDPQLLTPACGHARILCIEGSEHNLENIAQRLIMLGVEVLKTDNLDEGFWTCFTEQPHAILIYTDAPTAELRDALARFSQHPVTRNIPVVLIKGRTLDTSQLTIEGMEADNLSVVDASFGWDGVRRALAKIIPIGETDRAEPLPKTQPAKAAEESDVEPTPEEGQRQHMKILCIDDDPVIAKSISLRVQPYGIELISAANGTEGFYAGLRERPDLILLDLQMPEGDGQYALSKFRGHPLTQDIPVVILTAETNVGVRRKLTSLEASGFLSKPVRWQDFFEEIGRLIPLPRRLIDDYSLSDQQTPAHA